MDDSIEALLGKLLDCGRVYDVSILEKATNPKNRYEDWEFIMAFCDKVNASPEGWGYFQYVMGWSLVSLGPK